MTYSTKGLDNKDLPEKHGALRNEEDSKAPSNYFVGGFQSKAISVLHKNSKGPANVEIANS